ncbi:MAG TPA: hypothetical protein DDX54_00200 [Rhodospirillaceae bacterium]|jgi:hypothetical protein|nr:hypothetical protein [Alphaproteobacteria bacterium]HBH25815.1 hypothetical protein [Rhodospirillaceae bacterium]
MTYTGAQTLKAWCDSLETRIPLPIRRFVRRRLSPTVRFMRFLRETDAPPEAIEAFATYIARKAERRAAYADQVRAFRAQVAALDVSSDFFTGNIPQCIPALEPLAQSGDPVRILEIGSWEGMSTVFFYVFLPPGAHHLRGHLGRI